MLKTKLNPFELSYMKMGCSTFLKTGKIHLYTSPNMDAFLFKPSAAWKWINATADFT